MKKAVDFLKQNKSALMVFALLLVLIVIAISLNGGKSRSVISTGSSSQNKSVMELKLEQILSEIKGVGQADVMINESEDGIEGVIIVCNGANNIMTRNDILNVVSTALNVKENNIAIYAMNNQ